MMRSYGFVCGLMGFYVIWYDVSLLMYVGYASLVLYDHMIVCMLYVSSYASYEFICKYVTCYASLYASM